MNRNIKSLPMVAFKKHSEASLIIVDLPRRDVRRQRRRKCLKAILVSVLFVLVGGGIAVGLYFHLHHVTGTTFDSGSNTSGTTPSPPVQNHIGNVFNGVNIFRGYNSFGGNILSRSAIVGSVVSGDIRSYVEYIFCNSSDSVYEAFDIWPPIPEGYDLKSDITGKAAFVGTLNLTPYSVSIVVHARHISEVLTGVNHQLMNGINSPNDEDDLREFLNAYGDHFIDELTKGSEYYGVYTFPAKTPEEKSDLCLKIKSEGFVGRGELDLGFDAKLENILKAAPVNHSFEEKVLGISEPKLLTTNESQSRFAKDFLELKIDKPAILFFKILKYETLQQLGKISDAESNRRHFQSLAKNLSVINQLIFDLDTIKSGYGIFNYSDSSNITIEYEEKVLKEQTAFINQLRTLSQNSTLKLDRPPSEETEIASEAVVKIRKSAQIEFNRDYAETLQIDQNKINQLLIELGKHRYSNESIVADLKRQVQADKDAIVNRIKSIENDPAINELTLPLNNFKSGIEFLKLQLRTEIKDSISLINEIDDLLGIYDCYKYTGDDKLGKTRNKIWHHKNSMEALLKSPDIWNALPNFTLPAFDSKKTKKPRLQFHEGESGIWGNEHSAGIPFNDINVDVATHLRQLTRISSVTACAGKIGKLISISLLKVTYVTKDGSTRTVTYGQGGVNCSTEQLHPGQFITGVAGRKGDEIDRLELTLSDGRTLIVGGNGDGNFAWTVPDGAVLLGFKGHSCVRVFSIGAVYAKLLDATGG